MRFFFAVTLSKEIIARVTDVQQNLRKAIGDVGVKWTRPEQFHYTLRFLGEQPAPKAHIAVEAAQAVAADCKEFDFSLGGIGAFPNSQRPTILWIGASAGVEELTSLANTLEWRLQRAGFRKENQDFNAHLTISRIKGYAGEIAAVKSLKTADVGELGTVRVDRFVLMQSVLKPTGSEYTVVEEIRLTG
jgi:2'-5' RNA ligase